MLLARIKSEPLAIDLAMLFMEDDGLADAIIARHNAGVPRAGPRRAAPQ